MDMYGFFPLINGICKDPVFPVKWWTGGFFWDWCLLQVVCIKVHFIANVLYCYNWSS